MCASNTAYGSIGYPINFANQVFNVIACEGHVTGDSWSNANAFDVIGIDRQSSVLTGFSYYVMWAHNGTTNPGYGTVLWLAIGQQRYKNILVIHQWYNF